MRTCGPRCRYEVQLQDGLECGGAYLKFLQATGDLDIARVSDKTPYSIMFGPDRCGTTDKVSSSLCWCRLMFVYSFCGVLLLRSGPFHFPHSVPGH